MSTEGGGCVFVVGGGFAGAFAARALQRALPKSYSVELISERNYFVFQPLLPEVVGGTISAVDAVTPLRSMLSGVTVRMGTVRHIDFEAKEITIVQGSKRVPQRRSYAALVLAPGQETKSDLFPGLAEHSFSVRSLTDARDLRNHVLHCLEHADITNNAELKKRLLTFVVAGGGFSGVEIVGELQEMVTRTCKQYPNIELEDVQFQILQRSDRLLPELGPALGVHAAERLARRGVNVRLGESLVRATATDVYTKNGERIGTHTLVITIGSQPCQLFEQLELPLTRGRLEVSGTMQVPNLDAVWSLGDAAAIPLPGDRGVAPTTAQFAVQEARQLADNVAAFLAGREQSVFDYEPRGSLASIGHYDAVAEIYGRPVSGLFAWLLWRGVYLGMVPGFATKARIALNWAFDYILPRSTVQMAVPDEQGVATVHLSEGDVLFEPGQIIDGLYAVVEGTLESRIEYEGDREDFVRILGAGEHWGEKSLSSGHETIGQLTALEDCRILVLRRHEFQRLDQSLPFFHEHFENMPSQLYPREMRGTPVSKNSESQDENSDLN